MVLGQEEEEKAFLQLKVALTTAPILRLPDFDLQFVITTDASDTALGAILEQDFRNRVAANSVCFLKA